MELEKAQVLLAASKFQDYLLSLKSSDNELILIAVKAYLNSNGIQCNLNFDLPRSRSSKFLPFVNEKLQDFENLKIFSDLFK